MDNLVITLADGSRVAATRIGHVSPTSFLSLNSVLLIPGCPFNIISLSQLTRSHNCSVTFDANSFVIQERGTGRTIGVGHESHGLYYLKPNLSWVCSAATSPKLLHERLGHPHLSKLKIMVPSLEKIKDLFCESCQLGKHVRSSFRHAESHVDSSFSVIHSDIWGPSRVPSMGYRYFISFIDEFSRANPRKLLTFVTDLGCLHPNTASTLLESTAIPLLEMVCPKNFTSSNKNSYFSGLAYKCSSSKSTTLPSNAAHGLPMF